MATAYAIDVNVNLLNSLGGSSGGGGAGPAGGVSQLRDLDRGIQDVQRSSERMIGTWGKLFAFREMEKFGRAGVDAFKGVIENAGNLEESMLNVRLGLNLTADQTDRLKDKFYELDQAHKTSANEMARTALILQQSGVRDQAAMLGLMEPGGGAQGLLTFQDVMKSRAQPIAPEEAARLAMQFINTSAVVGPAAQAQMLDLVTRALQFDPQGSPGGLLGAFQNIHRTGDFAGLSLEQQMQLASLTTVGGQSGREATQIGHLVGQMELIGHSPGKAAAHKAAAMRKMGILGGDGNPTGDIFGLIDKIAALREKDPEGSKRLIATAFPDVRRQEEVLELTEPGKIAQLKAVQEAWGKLAPLAKQHELLMGGVNSQLTVFKSNLQDISSASGSNLLDSTKGIVTILNDFAGALKKWQQTPDGKSLSSGGAAVVGATSAALTAVGAAGQALLVLKMLGVTGAAVASAGAILSGGITGIAAGIGLARLGTDDNRLVHSSIADWVGQLPGLKQAIDALTHAILGKETFQQEQVRLTKEDDWNAIKRMSALEHTGQHISGTMKIPALHHMVRDASRGGSKGVQGGSGPTLNPAVQAGPR